jgi:hypothetical protein
MALPCREWPAAVAALAPSGDVPHRPCRNTDDHAADPRQPHHPIDPEDPTMNTTITAITTPAAPAPRVDLYAAIHKALRHGMTDTLHRIGRMDVFDAKDMADALGRLGALLDMCVSHIHHENDFVHTAIEARQPRGASRTADDHLEHFESIEALRADVVTLQQAASPQRLTLALRLYRHLALFVAENFQHMHVEETHNNALLWAHYDDAELMELHHRLVASIPPAENLEVARWMVPAVSPFERALIVGGMKASAPAPAFAAIIDTIRPHLDDSAWSKLVHALDLPRQPGLLNPA